MSGLRNRRERTENEPKSKQTEIERRKYIMNNETMTTPTAEPAAARTKPILEAKPPFDDVFDCFEAIL